MVKKNGHNCSPSQYKLNINCVQGKFLFLMFSFDETRFSKTKTIKNILFVSVCLSPHRCQLRTESIITIVCVYVHISRPI